MGARRCQRQRTGRRCRIPEIKKAGDNITIQLRPLQLPDDYAAMAELLNPYWSEPVTAQRLAEDDAKLYEVGRTWKDDNNLLAGYDRTRRVAVTETGQIAGYVWSWRAPWTEPGYLCNTLVTAPDWRNRGIGRMLLAHAVEWAQSLGASMLITEVWDDQPESLRFAQQYGFAVDRHAFQSVLPLKSGPIRSMAAAVPPVPGVRWLTLADIPGEAAMRKLYELSAETMADIPGFMGDVPDYEEWKKWYLKVDDCRPELVLIAAEGDRFVGMTHLLHNEATNGLYHEYTAVSRSHRGKRIAQTLKLQAIQLGIQLGADYIRTDNDSLNAAMLAINRKLGFEPLRGNYRVVAAVADAAARLK